MAYSPYEIIGFGATDFDPGAVIDVKHAAGAVSGVLALLVCALIGNKTSAGTMTADQDIAIAYDQVQADALTGPGSELARMYEWAAKVTGAVIVLIPNAESAGANAAMTVTFATTATSAGTFTYYFAGRKFDVAIASADTATVAGDSFAAAVAARPDLGFTAVNASGTVTCTWKQKGPRGNDQIVRQDISAKPTAMTSALGGGAALSAFGSNGRKFAGGTTADSVANVVTNTFAGWFHRVALASRDSTALAAWEVTVDAKSGWQEQHPQHTVVASNDTFASAQSLAQTTLNNARFCFLWALNQEQDPAELAAWFAAYRSVVEVGDPDSDYDGVEIPGATPFFVTSNNPQRSTRIAALRVGVTPLFQEGDKMTIRRAITTRCLNGTDPDYRVLDVGTAYVPDFIRSSVAQLWKNWKASNPVLIDDPAIEEPEPEEGVGYPRRWNQILTAHLKEHERGETVSSKRRQIVDVDKNLPSSILFKAPGTVRIMSAIPVVPAPRQHQYGANVLQR